MKAVIYCRFSPRADEATSTSNEKQVELCREYAKARGYMIVGEYRDDAASGADENRQGLWDAVYQMPPGSVLLAYSRDRLTRDAIAGQKINRTVAKRRCRIECVQGGSLPEGPEGKFIATVLDAVACMEREMKNARTKAKMLLHQRHGRRMGSQNPYGYRCDPEDSRRMLPDPDEQKTLAEMKQLYALGHGCKAIASHLTRTGRKARTAERWQHSAVKKILLREGVYGLRPSRQPGTASLPSLPRADERAGGNQFAVDGAVMAAESEVVVLEPFP